MLTPAGSMSTSASILLASAGMQIRINTYKYGPFCPNSGPHYGRGELNDPLFSAQGDQDATRTGTCAVRAKVGWDIKFYSTETAARENRAPTHRDPRTPANLKKGEKSGDTSRKGPHGRAVCAQCVTSFYKQKLQKLRFFGAQKAKKIPAPGRGADGDWGRPADRTFV